MNDETEREIVVTVETGSSGHPCLCARDKATGQKIRNVEKATMESVDMPGYRRALLTLTIQLAKLE